MKCPKCQFENPDDSKFCLECGEKIEITCPQCGKTLPIASKFCNECGHKLDAPQKEFSKPLSPEEKIEKILNRRNNLIFKFNFLSFFLHKLNIESSKN